ncbi:MAG TPA: hypothetical protein VMI54_31385 [Polyangiaceae bacterium]|nr:hypothetical protein [Polyangiaceae bacterium]
MSSRKPPPKPSRAPAAPGVRDARSRGTFELPPVPIAPPARRRFNSEPPTRQKNVAASVYQSLISVFDTMSPAERMEFVDAAALYAALDANAKRDLVALLALYSELWAADREQVHELVERLAAESTKKR